MQGKKKRSGLLDLGRQMQEMMDRAFRQAMFCDPASGASWTPFVDIAETSDAVLVVLEVPGVRRKDLSVDVESGYLVIRGKRREHLPDQTVRHHHIEIDRGSFCRAIQIPAGFDLDQADAKLEEGLLTIRLPKNTREASRIAVTEADADEPIETGEPGSGSSQEGS